VLGKPEIINALIAPDGEFPLARRTIDGRLVTVFEREPYNVRAMFLAGRARPAEKAIVYEDEVLTWAEFHDQAGRCAQALRDRFGVGRGDRVAIAMRNYPEWLVAFLATISLGAVAVPLNAWWKAAELGQAVADADPKVLIADAERARALRAGAAARRVTPRVVVVRAGERAAGEDDWAELLADFPTGVDLGAVPIDPEDACTILYTSGTTARAKGVVATHRAHASNLLNLALARALSSIESGVQPTPRPPVTAVLTPLFHIAGLQSAYGTAAAAGTVVLLYRWNADHALEVLEREGVVSTSGPPTLVGEMLQAMERSGKPLSALRSLASGAGQASSSLVKRIQAANGGRLTSGTAYGSTETTGVMLAIGSADFYARPTSVGRPVPTCEIRLVREDGTDARPGERGEAWLRGPNLARGYWGSDVESSAFTADGWYRTGDVMRQDEDGYYYLVDRVKDVIIRAGENVYAAEVEALLADHPDVLASAVVGVPDERLGEEVAAWVQVATGSGVDDEALAAYVRDSLAGFKVPTRWWLTTDPPPRTATGKIIKRELLGHFPPTVAAEGRAT
jgi:long-chain acyl-CoA synthetase